MQYMQYAMHQSSGKLDHKKIHVKDDRVSLCNVTSYLSEIYAIVKESCRIGNAHKDLEKYKKNIKKLVCWCIKSLKDGIIGLIIVETNVMFWHEEGYLIKYIGVKNTHRNKKYGSFLIDRWVN